MLFTKEQKNKQTINCVRLCGFVHVMWTACVFIFARLCTSTALNQTHTSVGHHVTIQRKVSAVREIKSLTGSVPQVTLSPCLF